MHSLKLVAFFVSFVVVFGEKARFDNYRVYSVKIQNEKQLEELQALENSQDGITYIEAPISVMKTAEILVPPHKFADVSDFFGTFDIEHEIKIHDLQRSVILLMILETEHVKLKFEFRTQIDRWWTTEIYDARNIRME